MANNAQVSIHCNSPLSDPAQHFLLHLLWLPYQVLGLMDNSACGASKPAGRSPVLPDSGSCFLEILRGALETSIKAIELEHNQAQNTNLASDIIVAMGSLACAVEFPNASAIISTRESEFLWFLVQLVNLWARREWGSDLA